MGGGLGGLTPQRFSLLVILKTLNPSLKFEDPEPLFEEFLDPTNPLRF